MERKQTHIMYGFVIGILMVIISVTLYLTGLTFKSESSSYIAQIPFLVGIILNAIAYSKANDGFVTFGNVFGSGFKASMIVALVMTAWMVIAIFVFPEMKEKGMEMARQKLVEGKQKMSDEQIEMSMDMMRKGWNYIMIGSAILGSMIMGAIYSLIGGAVAKKKGERPMTSGDNF